MVVDLLDELNSLVELLLLDVGCSREDDRSCVLDLVLIELGEVLKIYLALACIDNCNCSADLCAFNLLDSSNYVRELTYT